MGKTLQDLKDANARVDAASNAIGTQVGQVAANETAQLAELQRLRDQVASGAPVTVADFDALVENAQARAAALETIQSNLVEMAKDPNNPLPPADPIELPPVAEE